MKYLYNCDQAVQGQFQTLKFLILESEPQTPNCQPFIRTECQDCAGQHQVKCGVLDDGLLEESSCAHLRKRSSVDPGQL